MVRGLDGGSSYPINTNTTTSGSKSGASGDSTSTAGATTAKPKPAPKPAPILAPHKNPSTPNGGDVANQVKSLLNVAHSIDPTSTKMQGIQAKLAALVATPQKASQQDPFALFQNMQQALANDPNYLTTNNAAINTLRLEVNGHPGRLDRAV